MTKRKLSCSDCSTQNCSDRESNYPNFCITLNLTDSQIEEIKKIYTEDEENTKLAVSSAEIEGDFYCKLTRVEETIKFIKKIGAQKVGVATCIGLIKESKAFCKILEYNNIDYYTIACKVGSIAKEEIGISNEHRVHPDREHESMCNPILQAKILNQEKTDLNVVIGLCVGHDSLFIKYSDAPVTVLVAKDRVTCHNPVAPLYTMESYYKNKLLKKEKNLFELMDEVIDENKIALDELSK